LKKIKHPVLIRAGFIWAYRNPPPPKKNEKLGAIGQKLKKLKATYYCCITATAAAVLLAI
jgi:hypothetical protein